MTNPYQAICVNGLRLLVLDDYPDTREMFTTLFEAEGALIQAVATVDEVLNVISASSPDILISEIYLPDKAEHLLLAQLRNLQASLGRWIPEKYCASTGRPATDVIRELIRSLTITELSASEQTTPTLKYSACILK